MNLFSSGFYNDIDLSVKDFVDLPIKFRISLDLFATKEMINLKNLEMPELPLPTVESLLISKLLILMSVQKLISMSLLSMHLIPMQILSSSRLFLETYLSSTFFSMWGNLKDSKILLYQSQQKNYIFQDIVGSVSSMNSV